MTFYVRYVLRVLFFLECYSSYVRQKNVKLTVGLVAKSTN